MKETGLRKLYGKTIGKFIPEYGFLSLLSCFLINCLVYWGTQLMVRGRHHYDFTTKLDNRIPFIKEWVIIYLGCYIFWAVNYILISREGKEHWFRFAFADILSRIICGIIFVIIPTTNIRPVITDSDFLSWLMNFVYSVDQPSNLFPSLHCLVSWYCFAGIRKSKKIKTWYKVFSCVFAVLVCFSTQFTKQHYLVDIPAGIIVAELCYYIARHTVLYVKLEKIFMRLNEKVFGRI